MTPDESYIEAPWPVLRNLTTTVLDLQRPHTYLGFATMNVTLAEERMRHCQQATRRAITLHAYLMYCAAKAALEHPAVLTYRHGRRLITFNSVDVGTALLKRMPDGTQMPVIWVLRDAARKSFAEVQHEFRLAVRSDLTNDPGVRTRRRLAGWPGWLRKLAMRRALSNPFRLRQLYGNLQFTNLQLPTAFPFVAFPPHLGTFTLSAGTVATGFVPDAETKPVAARLMHLGGAIDHDVIDGIAALAYLRCIYELVGSADGLDDRYISQTLQLAREHPE